MLSNTWLVLGIIAVASLALAAGCGQSEIDKPLSAVLVGYPDESIHSPSGPRGMLVESEGNTRCLYSLYSDATVLVFLDESCLDPNSSVVRAAKAKESGVSIVEIAAPAADCGAHEECVRARGADVGNLASICDPMTRTAPGTRCGAHPRWSWLTATAWSGPPERWTTSTGFSKRPRTWCARSSRSRPKGWGTRCNVCRRRLERFKIGCCQCAAGSLARREAPPALARWARLPTARSPNLKVL